MDKEWQSIIESQSQQAAETSLLQASGDEVLTKKIVSVMQIFHTHDILKDIAARASTGDTSEKTVLRQRLNQIAGKENQTYSVKQHQ